MVVPDPTIYEFGPYRVVSHQGLFRRGEFVPLAPKEFAVLTALVSRRGGVVTKEQLIAEVWPRDFVSDESIARCIYVLRRTLEQTPAGDGRVFIQTLHRRGYRLVVPVRILDSTDRLLPAPNAQQQAAVEQCRLGYGRLGFCSWGDIEQAIVCFQKALELDSSCALAYAGMGEATIIQAGHGWIDVDVARQMLRGLVEAGRTFDPQSGSLHALSAMVAGMFEWNWRQAESDANKAAELGGGYQASLALGNVPLCLGRPGEAIPHFENAVRAAPYVPHCHEMLIWALLAQEDFDRAYTAARRAAEMLPSITGILQGYSVAASYCERHDEAIAAAERAAALAEREMHALATCVTAFARGGRMDEAREVYAEIFRLAQTRKVIWSSLAPEMLLMEGTEACLGALERAWENRCCILAIKCTDPRLRPLRSEPRFQAVMNAIYAAK